MTSTINRINSAMEEIDRLHEILADDIAGLSQMDPSIASQAIASKRKAAQALESSRRELESLKVDSQKWVRRVNQLE
jgi:hypothetical protein